MNDNKFTRELKPLIYYVREYGIRRIDFDISDKSLAFKDSEKADAFYYHCHQGFFAAQDRVICLLRKLLLEQKRLKTALKDARRERYKEEENKIDLAIQKARFQEQVLRKLMDAIAWQLFNYDLSTMRRLYCGEPAVDITNSNLDSELSFIKYYKEAHPSGFSLISDLTSFIQIGDVVTIDKDTGVCIAELKEGRVNKQVFGIIEEVSKTQCANHLSRELEDKDENFLKQFKRVVRQMGRTNQVFETITTGHGTDLYSGQEVRIVQGEFSQSTYFDTLHDLAKNCHKKGYAISVVEECLLIGVYDTQKFPSHAFDAWSNMLKIKTPIYDMRASFFDPLSFPIFLHSFSVPFILDLILGRKVIKMCIDFEKWLTTFEKDGCKINWLSKKQTSKINATMKGESRIFDINGQGVEIERDGMKQVIGRGIFSRLYTSFLTPSSIKNLLLTMLVSPLSQ